MTNETFTIQLPADKALIEEIRDTLWHAKLMSGVALRIAEKNHEEYQCSWSIEDVMDKETEHSQISKVADLLDDAILTGMIRSNLLEPSQYIF